LDVLTERAAVLARRRGDRRWESELLTARIPVLSSLGRWDDALAVLAAEESGAATETARLSILEAVPVYCERGQLEEASALFETFKVEGESDSPQTNAGIACIEARLLRALGRPADALTSAERGLSFRADVAIADTRIKRSLTEAVEAALELADLEKAEALLATAELLEPGELTPYLQGHADRLRARLDSARGRSERVDERFRRAAAVFREFGLVFYLAVTQLEHAGWLASERRDAEAEPLLVEARATFEQLRAAPWLERIESVAPAAISA
jgi:tetratricopeptide (TPR) repeat protein